MKLSPEALAVILDLPPPSQTLPPATGVAFHSGRVVPGDAFFALPGEAMHGIRFADDALAAGAAYVVSDRPHDRGMRVPDPVAALLALGRHARAAWTAPVVAVTGSAGKTSTKELLAAALDAQSSAGNFNTPYALSETLVDAWLAGGSGRPLVLEVGIDRVGEMAQLAALVDPDAAVLTLVGHSHLDGLGTLAGVASEKSLLLRAARASFASMQACAFLDQDLHASTTSYGLAPAAADVVGGVEAIDSHGLRLVVNGTRIELPHPSRATAVNAVGAFAVATALGTRPVVAAERLARAPRPAGRLQVRTWAGGTLLDDTYNSNPASAAVALDTLRRFPRPHIAILGDMLELGDLSPALHRELGAATRGLDRVLAHGPASRAVAEANPHARWLETFEGLVAALAGLPHDGTVLVKASRGMALERVVRILTEEVPA